MSIQVKPFIGPQPFKEGDSPFFYGRDKEIQEILALILSSGVSLVYAKSGIGKTSIFNAKIIPELQGEKYKFQVLPIIRFKTAITSDYEMKKETAGISNIYVFNTLQGIIEKTNSKPENMNILKEKLPKMTLSEFLRTYNISHKENF